MLQALAACIAVQLVPDSCPDSCDGGKKVQHNIEWHETVKEEEEEGAGESVYRQETEN